MNFQSYSQLQHGSPYRVPSSLLTTPQSASHIFVTALSTTSSPVKVMEVYAIEVGQGQWLSEGEVRNRFYDSFGLQLQGAIRVVSGSVAKKAGEGGKSPDLSSMGK